MEMQRLIIQMAFATDLTGRNMQTAMRDALARALSQADLPAAGVLGVEKGACVTQVTLGVPDVGQLDPDTIERLKPDGVHRVICRPGGQTVVDAETGARQYVVTAAAEIFLPRQEGWQLRGGTGQSDVVSSSEAP